MANFFVQNFGCRATQADGAAIERQFEELGLSCSPADVADVVVLNTCTVTAAADQDARAAIRRVRRHNPAAKLIVTGCYAQRAPDEIAALPGVTAVVGNSHKHRLAEIAAAQLWAGDQLGPRKATFVSIESLLSNGGAARRERAVFVSDIFAHTELLAAPVFEASARGGSRTRPTLKIQDGCDNRCSFCVIPSVRGQSRSLRTAEIIAEVRALVAAGYREIVLSGINLGRWGRDLPASRDEAGTFASLLPKILAETSIEKIRISSVEPMDWSDALIALVASSARIAKHAHVPLQSGSDAVLRRMHRKYRPWHYREKIEKIRAAMPDAAIGADVMVGFPGETAAEFDQTRRLIEELPFTYLHVFTYSPRPGTPAEAMPEQVPVHVVRERNRILRELGAEKHTAFLRSFVGTQLEAITLAGEGRGWDEGTDALTDNFLKLRLEGQHDSNRWVRADITGISGDSLAGREVTGAARNSCEEIAPGVGNSFKLSQSQLRSRP